MPVVYEPPLLGAKKLMYNAEKILTLKKQTQNETYYFPIPPPSLHFFE